MKEKLKVDLTAVSLKQLRVLKAVAAGGSFSKASQLLNVTPPAVTLQMKLLEQAVTMPLVERANRKLRLTDAGRQVLEAAHRIEATLGECAEALQSLSGAERGGVAVGVISTAKYFAPRALAVFTKAHPGIDMRLTIGNRKKTITALENYDLDLTIMGRPPDSFEVESAVIGDHPHIIIAPPDHPLARDYALLPRRSADQTAGRTTGHPTGRSKSLSVLQLASETFLLREDGSGTRALMQRLFAKQGLDPGLGLQIGSNETIKQAVMAGLGIALISAHTVAAELSDGRLVALNVASMPLVRKWYVVRRRDKRLLPAAQSLWDFLAACGRDFLPRT